MTELTIASISSNGSAVRTAGTLEEPLFMAKDIAEAVENRWNGLTSIKHIPDDFRVLLDNTLPNGAVVKTWYLNELGLYFYLNRSDSPLALPWQRKVAETLKAIRQGSIAGANSGEIKRLREELTVWKFKSQIMEEHTDSEPLDYDQVASMLAEYMRPPFGPKHLKEWLRKHGILTTANHKNDQPNRKYINRGWFTSKTHKWQRGGQWRFETRYFITWFGFSKMTDIAIRERLLILPGDRQDYLPGIYEEPLRLIS